MLTSSCFSSFARLHGGACLSDRAHAAAVVPAARSPAGGRDAAREGSASNAQLGRALLFFARCRSAWRCRCSTGVGHSLARARLLSGAGRARPLPSSLSPSLLGAGGRSCPRAHRSASAARCGATRSLRLGRAYGGGDADAQPQVVKAGKKVGGFGHRARGNCRHDMCVAAESRCRQQSLMCIDSDASLCSIVRVAVPPD